MERDLVSSSNIMSAGYDPDNETLEIEFKGGTVYQYYNVDAHLYEQFSGAASKGQFFNANIKNSFPFSRVG
ncbi:KTSC domain-containing protein [Serratia liquefaciens]|uniref:KTSC domain-containing protein n=1 Tax=Serratia TaxID=613 RepID=UPI000665F73C|nr:MULTISPECIES: KTSC domain-containing protein [Serratia]RYM62708.1 KTSC domain-containing protein [Serratia liquefaciens]HBK4689244.1 KTSC domain-containing protein [Serratia marcescens]